MIKIFIGYDPRETVAYHVLSQSLLEQSSVPLSITPVNRKNMWGVFTRERGPKESTEFSISRFMVPAMIGYYNGHVLFMDCDMLCRGDIAELFALARTDTAVQVVKHNYAPSTDIKFLGQEQTKYKYKNWSSVMLFNCGHCDTKHLTQEYVNKAPGLDLHQFKWCDEERIGELPRQWNHLVGEYPYDPDAKIVHFTVGGPYFAEYENCDYSEEWFDCYRRTKHCDQLPVPRLKVSQR